MTIKNRMLLGTLAPIAILLVIAAISLATQRHLIQVRHIGEEAQGVVNGMFDLNLLTHEYLKHGSERAGEQWRNKHAHIMNMLNQLTIDDADVMQVVNQMQADHELLLPLFTQLENSGDQSNREFAERLAGQLQAKAHAAVSQASRLADASHKHAELINDRARLSLVVGVVAAIALIVTNSIVFVRSVMEPIALLRAGALAVGGGNLEHRINYRATDEAGDLARAFDNMADQLQTLTGSLEQQVAERTRELEASRETALSMMNDAQAARFQTEWANRELKRSNKELEQFAYVASHDLQEPMRKIQAFGDLLMQRYQDHLGPEGADFLKRMHSAAARMRTLIDDLLAYSRVTTRGRPFERVDLNKIAAEVAGDLDVAINESAAKLQVGELPTIDADPLQMRQLFQNLIGNSLKYRKSDSAPDIRVQGHVDDSMCRVSIQDHGIGFDEKYVDRIFAPFQRLHGRTEYKGTGIGLAIVEKIVHRHGGTITASSKPGEGSTFVVSLPLRQKSKEQQS